MSQATNAEPFRGEPRRRRPWLAALMSLLWLGVGQLYNGEARKALAFFAVWAALLCAVVVLTIAATPGPVTIVVLYFLAALVVALAIYAAVDAFRQARRLRAVVLKRYQRAWLYALSAVAVLLFSNAARLSAWRPFSVPSASMVPTVEPGEYIKTKRYARAEAPQRGDLAIFHFPPDRSIEYFKRIIGLPGDRVQLRGGVVYLNGAPFARERSPGRPMMRLKYSMLRSGGKWKMARSPRCGASARAYRFVMMYSPGSTVGTIDALGTENGRQALSRAALEKSRTATADSAYNQARW